MSALYLSMADGGNEQIVRGPHRTDAIGAALRGIYGSPLDLPREMAELIRQLARTR